MHGTHVRLKTASGTVPVHLAPTAFLSEQGLVLAEGEGVQIVGAQARCGGRDAFVAREVRKGMEVFVLRDAQGAPLWPAAGPGCRARHHRTHH